ncbi:MAG TPA: hypothetical protein V6C97_16315 [Oculatellaceae cyanobacterium]
MNETEKPVVNDILPIYVRDKGGPVQQATIKSIEAGLKKVKSQFPKFITYLQNEKAYVNAYKLDPDNNSYEMGETTNTQIMGREGPLEFHFITIFENYSSINGPKPNDDVSGTVLHELGHMLDSVLEANNAPGLVYSQSTEFETALKRDLEQVQAKDPDLYKILTQNFGPSTTGRSELVANLFAAHFGRKPVNMLTENVVPAKLINSFPNVLLKLNEMSQKKMGIYIFPEATKNVTTANTKAQAAPNSNSFFENILNQATGQSSIEQSGITPDSDSSTANIVQPSYQQKNLVEPPVTSTNDFGSSQLQSDSALLQQPAEHRSSSWTTTTSSETENAINQNVQAKTASVEAGGDDTLASDASSSNHDAIASVSSWLKSWQSTTTNLNPQAPQQPQESQPQENQQEENKPQEDQQQENQQEENKPQEDQQQENQQEENKPQEDQQQENQQQEGQDQQSERQTTNDASTSDASSSNHEAIASVNSWLKSWQSTTTSLNPQNPNQPLEEQPLGQQPSLQETQHEEQSTQQQQQSPWQQRPASNDSAPLTGFSDERGNTVGENPRQQSGSSGDSVLQFQQLQNDSNTTQTEEQNEQEERERGDQLEEDATRAANEAAAQNARDQAARAQSLAEEAQALATQPGQADAARALASQAAALANGAEQQGSDSSDVQQQAADAESLAESAKQTADQDENDKDKEDDTNDNNDSNDSNDVSKNDGDNTSDNTNNNDDDSQQSDTSDDSESDSREDSNDESSESNENDSSDENTESSDD